jgi:ADP-heptose:LPS heptosyltransferase
VSNILLVRLDGIGDALVCAPLVVALRDAGHEVGALLSTRNAEAFVEGVFAQVHAVERIPWPEHGSTPESHALALRQARTVGYDVALVASEEPEAYGFAREAGIPQRVGFTNGREKPLKSFWAGRQLTRTIVREASARRARRHEVETLFRLGDGLQCEDGPTCDVGRLRPLVCERGASESFVALQVARKVHADERGLRRFAAIVESVADRFRAVVFGSPADAELAHATAGATAEVRIFERVGSWRTALCRARAVVTPDSGAAHVAGMAGVPCVDLFEPSANAAYDIVRWRPWAAPSRTLILGPDLETNAAAVSQALVELIGAPQPR